MDDELRSLIEATERLANDLADELLAFANSNPEAMAFLLDGARGKLRHLSYGEALERLKVMGFNPVLYKDDPYKHFAHGVSVALARLRGMDDQHPIA